MSKNDLNSKDFLIGALVGSAIGAAAALFLAPKAGKDFRIEISQKATEVRDRTSEFKNNAIEKSGNLASYAKEKTANLSQIVSEQSSQIMNKVRDFKGSSQEQADIAESEIADALKEVSNSDEEIKENREAIELPKKEEVVNSAN
ncbi:YtxH domain-containing protein [Metabacillus fastidiosus]|uniref:YtxH domain-containing protein n=1 Tax=Metabacillus fastidiosus TaxID=1458 RepID=UPI003D2D0D33